MGHALIVEDDSDAASMLEGLIVRERHSVATAGSLQAARRELARRPPDVLLLDLHLPDGSGFQVLDEAELLADTQVVLMTARATLDTSIQALRRGVADYLVKPINPQHLRGLLTRLIRPSQLRAEVEELQAAWRQTGRFGALIGASEPMQRVYRQIARVAGTSVTVFLHGESGTGKELVARAVHDLGRRRERPFLAINCGALSPHLVESELFGHERGSFTGADRQHLGFFERADGGTLFLDEITEMPLALQVKLLRVLESGSFMRVGSTQLQQTDVRIIAATNRDAAGAVAQGQLREDLFYRLNVFPITLPPLRERLDDVPLLARSFLRELERQEQRGKRFSSAALAQLAAWHWPGNVRELRNAVQRAWVMADDAQIDGEWLPGGATSRSSAAAGEAPAHAATPADAYATAAAAATDGVHIPLGTALADAERRLILATFAHCGGHRERTAAVLGISLKTLYNRLKEYGATPEGVPVS